MAKADLGRALNLIKAAAREVEHYYSDHASSYSILGWDATIARQYLHIITLLIEDGIRKDERTYHHHPIADDEQLADCR